MTRTPLPLLLCFFAACGSTQSADGGVDAGRMRFVDDGGVNDLDGGGMCIKCSMIVGFLTGEGIPGGGPGGGPGGPPGGMCSADGGMTGMGGMPGGGSFSGCNPTVFNAFTGCLMGPCSSACGIGGMMNMCGPTDGGAPATDAGASPDAGSACTSCLETQCGSTLAACKAD